MNNKLKAMQSRRSVWNSAMDHDEEWERKKMMFRSNSSNGSTRTIAKKYVGRCSSDCTGYGSKKSAIDHSRTRSLTDADLDELRGCIDLGFGFNESDPGLWDTIPALELCYAISQSFNKHASSADHEESDDGGFSPSSASFSPSSASSSPTCWPISTPGDGPQQVKARLRQWARAVACTVEQQHL